MIKFVLHLSQYSTSRVLTNNHLSVSITKVHGRIETSQPLTNQLTSTASGVKAEK